MSLSELSQTAPIPSIGTEGSTSRHRHLAFAFTGAIFLSAFLLFGVQPMFTKMVLPWLGGSPAVWSVAMVFFQGLLLLGYLYAHLSTMYLSPKVAVGVHAVLAALAFLTLPLTVSQSFGAPPETGQGLWLLMVFSVSVGLPFFVLSATAPLMQAWFARSGHARADNPYFLYVASNAGSFAALIAYPLLIEPLTALQSQRMGWMWLFAVLGAALALCGAMAIASAKSDEATFAKESAESAGVAEPLTLKQRAIWTGLASIPSGLLVAVTAHLSTDVASAPLLWVLPLALFMLTFILAFREKMFVRDATLATWFARLVPFVAMSIAGFLLPLAVQFAIHLGVFFMAAMICHRQLYLTRPSPAKLTAFYLWMSFGGMLGGLFAGLLAPLLFSTIVEYPLLIVVSLLCLPLVDSAPTYRKQAVFALFSLLIGAGFILVAPLLKDIMTNLPFMLGLAITAGFLAIIIFNRSGPLASAGAAAGAFLALVVTTGGKPEAVVRSFFGVNYVKLSENGNVRLLVHGSTIHGAYRISDLDGRPMPARPLSTTYYHEDGGINIALKAARAHAGGKLGSVAVLGLGVGAMACQAVPGETWSYYEIDQEVVKLAQNPAYFPFLSSCTPNARVVVGDARLMLQKETVKYDVIILDAFSSDAVPAHLLTSEAFKIYAGLLNPQGMIIAHVSNRYMDLRAVAEAGAQSVMLKSAYSSIRPNEASEKARLSRATPTSVVAMAHDANVLKRLLDNPVWQHPSAEAEKALWTDDFANIMASIISQQRKPAEND